MNKVTNEIYDGQLDRIPRDVRYCKKCVVSNQRPRIEFNEEGICSACLYAYEKHHVIDWSTREKELKELLSKYRSKDGSFDVVVPSSGGKDSAVVAHRLKHDYGMHPLTITWAPFIYTDIGWKNYIAMKDSGFDNLLFFPDGVFHRKLAFLAFDLLGDAWEPFAYGQMSWAFHCSVKFNIPLIFFGENGEVEYGGTMRNKDKKGEPIDEWSEIYYKGGGIDFLIKKGLENGVFTKEEIANKDYHLYSAPPIELIKKTDTQMHWWSYYKKWVPQEHYYHSVENTGFVANSERSEGTYSKYASLDDKTDGFHFYLAYIKFGIARATSDAAHEIRDGHLTREEGVALVKKYDGEFPSKYYKDFLEYLNISDADFWRVINKFRARRPHLWEKVGDEWRLKHAVFMQHAQIVGAK